jgi:hypothetical protein
VFRNFRFYSLDLARLLENEAPHALLSSPYLSLRSEASSFGRLVQVEAGYLAFSNSIEMNCLTKTAVPLFFKNLRVDDMLGLCGRSSATA